MHFKYFQSQAGKMLRNLMEEKSGLGIPRTDYSVDYAYDQIPTVLVRDKYQRARRYKPVTVSELNKRRDILFHKIVTTKPEVIIPTGGLGGRLLLSNSSISAVRGSPQWVDVEYEGEVHSCWVLPIYSIEYMLAQPKVQRFIETDFRTLSRYIKKGDKGFQMDMPDYGFIDTIEKFRELMVTINSSPVISWDLETNALKPQMPGAKVILCAITGAEGAGYSIPIRHKEFTWAEEDLEEILETLKVLFADPNKVKVGQNIKFDMTFLRLTEGFTSFQNHRDTKIMYYLSKTQDVEDSLRLSDLAYEFTDLGGYDRELDDFKKEDIARRRTEEAERVKILNDEARDVFNAERDAHLEYVAEIDKKIADLRIADEDVDIRSEKIVVLQEEKKTAEAPPRPARIPATPIRNEVDGTEYNYEWFPLYDMMLPYAGGDVDVCLRIHNRLLKEMDSDSMIQLATEFYPELIDTLSAMEANGAMLDTDYNDVLVEAYTAEIERLRHEELRPLGIVQELEAYHRELYERGLKEFAKPPAERDPVEEKLRNQYKHKLEYNPSPNAQDTKLLLYNLQGVKLPYNREFIREETFLTSKSEDDITWKDYKGDKHALAYIVDHYDGEIKKLAENLLHYSLVQSRKQGFTESLREEATVAGAVHTRLLETGTTTSRLASRNPNLQNVPRRPSNVANFDYQYPIKRQFVSRFDGGAVLEFDFQALESRLLGLVSKDAGMLQAFLDGRDIHTDTASDTWRIPEEEVTRELREMAKAVGFGIAYGETPFSFHAKHDMTLEEAEDVFEAFFRNKQSVERFIDKTHQEVVKNGYVETMSGFRRYLTNVYAQDNSTKNEALRQSVNTIIQGTGGHMTNQAVINMQKFLVSNNLKSKLILTVHDSLVVDTHPEEVAIVAYAGKYVMENLPMDWLTIIHEGEKIKYPIEADVDIGLNYNDMCVYDTEEFREFNSVEGYCRYKFDMDTVTDYLESDAITKEKGEEMIAKIEASKLSYQQI